jgi:hypothetical protein
VLEELKVIILDILGMAFDEHTIGAIKDFLKHGWSSLILPALPIILWAAYKKVVSFKEEHHEPKADALSLI